MCSNSFNRHGDHQLFLLSQAFREGHLAPNFLHIGIEATNQAWMDALVFMPCLVELVIYSARPSSLGAKVFRSLVVQLVDSNSLGATSTPGQPGALLCPWLKQFALKYDHWLQPSEEFDLIPAFMSIIRSRAHSGRPLRNFKLQMKRDQMESLELIKGSGLSVIGLRQLADESKVQDISLKFTVAELNQACYICTPNVVPHSPSYSRSPAGTRINGRKTDICRQVVPRDWSILGNWHFGSMILINF